MTDIITLWLGERLLIGSMQAILIVSLVWLTCRLLHRIPAAAQAALWWLVALKLVLVFAPVPVIPLPVLPANVERQAQRLFLRDFAETSVEETARRSWIAGNVADAVTVQSIDSNSSGIPRGLTVRTTVNPWFQGLILIWLAAIVVQAARLAVAHRHLRRVVSRSQPWPGDEMNELARRIGLKRTPPARLSHEIDSPQVFGLWSPVVLLPAETMSALSEDERTMTLCHELMHIRRRDLLFGWVPACAERLFFFHPLARLSAREYMSARESACDAAAVRALGVEAGDYGRMLVRLGIGNTRPALSAGGSPFSTSSLKRRLEMLESRRLSTLSRRWRWAIAVIAAVVIPMQLVARTPEAPQMSGPGFDVSRLMEGVLATIQGMPSRETLAQRPQPESSRATIISGHVTGASPAGPEKLELDDADLQIETDGDVFRVEAEKLRIEKLKTKLTQDLEEKEVEIRLKVAKLMEQAEQNRKAESSFAQTKLKEVLLLLEKAKEANDKKRWAGDISPELKQGALRAEEASRQEQRLRELLERLEQLAAEQRQLVEEIRRMQANSPGR